MVKVGIVGGSGLDDPGILKDFREKEAETAYGKPSSPLVIGKIQNVNVIIIARHGRNHQYSPTKINYRANIQALKEEGCTHILATTAVGSLNKNIERGDVVILDQFIDFTRHRHVTFHDSFEKEMVHASMAFPFNDNLRGILLQTALELGFKAHEKGTVITIEGPRFSTKAESKLFRTWGADVINMSIAPEAILANEAKIPYAVVALSTDYDCLFDDIEPVTWEEVLEVFKQNAEKLKKILINAVPKIK